MPSRRILWAVPTTVAALAALFLVQGRDGGGSRLSKAQYEQKVRSDYANVQEAFRETNVQSTKLLAARVGEAQSELRRAADDLDKAQPPIDVEKEHDHLVEGMRDYADDLDELRQAAERNDAAGVQRFNQAIVQNAAVRQMAEAAEEMKFEGYDLGPIAED
jgi:hypothetical protein